MVKRKKTGDVDHDAAAAATVAAAAAAAAAAVGSEAMAPPPPTETTSGRRKKVASSRIGRACDRCQHRKLACDPAPEGCPPCQKVNAWCTVTDPLTGTPTYRGEFEYLERQVSKQHNDIQDLVARLKTLGEDVSAYEEETPEDRRYRAWMQVKASGDTRPWDREEKQLNVSRHLGAPPVTNGGSAQVGATGTVTTELPLPLDAPSNDGALKLPDLRTGLAQSDPNKYVGVAVSHPGSGRGAKLNILGWQLDLAAVAGKEVGASAKPLKKGEAVYDQSYRSFIATAFGQNPRIPRLDLPPKDDLVRTVATYLHTTHAFCPIFHALTLMDTVSRVHDETQKGLSDAEEVCLHMIVAISCYSGATLGTVESRAPLLSKSDRHYHFALGHLSQLVVSDRIEDVQALVLIALHVRCFPAPEIGWMAASLCFNRLVQLGYHRSMRAPTMRRNDKTFLEIEIRKRVFWSMLTILVTASGKLGRPMPLRLEDFDVEVPMPVADEQLLESGLDTSKAGECGFLIGIEAAKVASIFLELYNVMYATKRSSKEYMQFVGIAERRLKGWQDQWPAVYQQSPDETNDPFTRIIISYLHFWSLEFKLLLHHPSLSLTKSYQFNDTNLRVCLEASKDMLRAVRRMQELQCLDVTWYNVAVYLLAIQTTIYGWGQLKEQLTEAKLSELRTDMMNWLDVLKDIGRLLGSGLRLQQAVGEQVTTGMAQLEKSWRESCKAAAADEDMSSPEVKNEPNTNMDTAAPPSGPFTFTKPPPSNTTYPGDRDYSEASGNVNTFAGGMPYGYPQQQPQPQAAPQPPHPPPQQQQQQQQAPSGSYGGSHGPYAPPYALSIPAQAMPAEYSPHGAPTPTGSMQPMFDQSPHHFTAGNPYGADSESWFQYTQTIPNGIGPSDYQPASALLQLGGRSDASMGGGMPMGADAYDAAAAMSNPQNVMWSLNNMDNTHPPNN